MQSAVGMHAMSIEHVGSTAVPNLLAKPVIDIAIAGFARVGEVIDPEDGLVWRWERRPR